MRLTYKRVGWGIFAVIALLLVLVVTTVVYVTTTTSGLKQLVAAGQRWLPGELQVEQIEGTLLDSVSLQQLSYQNESISIAFQQFRLAWDPAALLNGSAHIRSLTLEQPVIRLLSVAPEPIPDTTAEKPLFPLVFPDLKLPLRVQIDHLNISQLAFYQPPIAENPSEPLLLDQFLLQAYSKGSSLIVEQLQLVAPQGKINLAGRLQPVGNYPFNFSTEWSMQQPDQPDLKGKGLLRGNLAELVMDQQLSGMLDLNVFASMRLSADTLTLDKLQILQPAKKAELLFSGEITALETTPNVALTGSWKNLGYPLHTDAVYSSSHGSVKLSGSMDKYQLTLKSALDGIDIPAGQWLLNADGNAQALTSFALSADTLDGKLRGNGKVSWQPYLSWQAVLSGEQINPGKEWSEWPGKLDFVLHSNGALQEQKPLQLQADLTALTGTLRNEPLKGSASISLTGSELAIKQLHLNVASAELQASGVVGEQMNLDWMLNAPTLAKVLPGAEGVLNGKGTLRGPKDQLHLVAALQGKGLMFAQNQIEDLSADLDIDLSAKQSSHLQLQATELNLAGQRWQTLTLNGQGKPAQHQLALTLEQGAVDLKLAVKGGWQAPQWRGAMTRADVDNELLGAWQLQRPVDITASAAKADLASFCWQRTPLGSGELCGQGGWSSVGGSQGELNVRQLALAMFEHFMPPGTKLDGQFEAQTTFRQPAGKQPDFSLVARISDSQLVLQDADMKVSAGDIRLNASGRQGQIKADFQLPLTEPVGQMQADLTIDDAYGVGKLTGKVQTELSDLKFISLFAPQLQAVSGKVESQLNISGNLEKPQVLGYLQLANASAELPALGLKLDAIELDIRDQPASSVLLLKGALRSGEGVLQLSGLLDPLNSAGQVSIQGERFQAVATEELKAWISPQLDIDVTPGLIKLRGEVKVPEAQIFPPTITSSSPLSPDVVILGDSESGLGKQQLLDAKVRLTLGDKVEVDALGFKGRLQGSVLVEDDGRRATRATGSLQVAAGEYRLYGQDLNIERGSLVFSGGPVDNPGLDLRVSREVGEVTAGAKVSGTLSDPRLTLFSEPVMPESSLLSYLIFGRAPGSANTSSSEQELLFRAASAITMKGGNVIAEKLTDLLDVNELGLEGDSLQDTSFYIGKYLSPKLYVKYGVGLLEPSSTFLMRYLLSKRWSVESQTGTNSSGGDIIYTLEN